MPKWLMVSVLVGLAGPIQAAEKVDYQRDIKPLLAEKCGVCHGALKQEVGLRLDAGVLIRKGSEGGPVVVPGDAAASLLIQKVSAGDPDERMPPEEEGAPLNEKQIAMLSAWINAGAKVPEDETIPVDPALHWAYQAPIRRRPPLVKNAHWRHPIDAFIARQHQRQGLKAAELADRLTLLRRVYLDLIGLPPTPQQIEAFVQDTSPRAWRRVVDHLLASPHYGERWGRRWMDVWRYSDWDGYKQQLRGSQRHIWRWRNWIIQSLNQDKGYDRMIVEMLAGDEAAPGDPSVLAATGFLARNYHTSNRNIWLDATVEHTAKAFLGLTLNCARCHDHKYDPIPQTAYYQFRAIFEPHHVRTDRIPGQPNLMKDGLPRAFDSDLQAPTFVYVRGNEKHPDKDHPVRPATPSILGERLKIHPIDLPREAYYPALKEFLVKEELAAAQKQLAAAEKAAAGSVNPTDQLKQTVARLRVESLQTRQAAEQAKFAESSTAQNTQQIHQLSLAAAKIERRFNAKQAELALAEKRTALQKAQASAEKDAKKKQAMVAKAKKDVAEAQKKHKAALEALKKTDGEYSPLGKKYPTASSGRRLALARWIADRNNPLTARVAVNHIWMRHFGAPLVDNVFDFGLRSPKPPHADLMDWLALELMENDWSLKHLHRLIVTSRTWRLASSATGPATKQNRSIDPDNRYLWRMNMRRLEAEIVRDSALAVSGQLDGRFGGADIDFRQGETSRRRSIYLRHAYEKQMTMLVLFDAASPNECYRRSESIVPQQALALANSSMWLRQSRLLAGQLWRTTSGDGDAKIERFVHQAFLRILSRPPEAEELIACLQFLQDQTALLSDTSKLHTFAGGGDSKVKPAKDARQRARENLVHVLMNHNDFVVAR